MWLRADGALPDDPVLHACVVTYASDMTLLDTTLLPFGLDWDTPGMQMASLDHAMWFHRPFRADDWLLYDQSAVSTSSPAGMAQGSIFTSDGRLAVSVVQEGLTRLTSEQRHGPVLGCSATVRFVFTPRAPARCPMLRQWSTSRSAHFVGTTGPRSRPADRLRHHARRLPRASSDSDRRLLRPRTRRRRSRHCRPWLSGDLLDDVLPPPAGDVVQYVTGGSPAADGEFPWTTFVLGVIDAETASICGGTLVAPTYVLTAAHCLEGTIGAAVRRDVTTLSELKEESFVIADAMIMHPEYVTDGAQADLALLRLATPITTPVVSLSHPDDAALSGAGVLATVAGWGLTDPAVAESSDDLQKSSMPIRSAAECVVANPAYLDASNICAGYLTGEASAPTGACVGDSGGPLMVTTPDSACRCPGRRRLVRSCLRLRRVGQTDRVHARRVLPQLDRIDHRRSRGTPLVDDHDDHDRHDHDHHHHHDRTVDVHHLGRRHVHDRHVAADGGSRCLAHDDRNRCVRCAGVRLVGNFRKRPDPRGDRVVRVDVGRGRRLGTGRPGRRTNDRSGPRRPSIR